MHQASMCSLADESLVEANRAAQAAAVARLPAQKQTTVSCAQPLRLSHFSPAQHSRMMVLQCHDIHAGLDSTHLAHCLVVSNQAAVAGKDVI